MVGWIGVDFDGTLCEYYGYRDDGEMGAPVAPMMERVKDWLERGIEVRIFTARAPFPDAVIKIQDWCERAGLPRLAVTNAKDFGMIELWDDRCIRVQMNTGRVMSGEP